MEYRGYKLESINVGKTLTTYEFKNKDPNSYRSSLTLLSDEIISFEDQVPIFIKEQIDEFVDSDDDLE